MVCGFVCVHRSRKAASRPHATPVHLPMLSHDIVHPPSTHSNVRPQEAESVFELFPPVQKMPAWQSFLAAGESGDAGAVRTWLSSGRSAGLIKTEG